MAFSPDVIESAALERYDLTPPVETTILPRQGVNNRLFGVRTGGGNFVAKAYIGDAVPASIQYEHDLLQRLDGSGLSFAVPTPLPDRVGNTLHEGPHGRWSIARWLPGEPLDLTDSEQTEAFGAALGELQIALARFPIAPRPGRALCQLWFGFPPRSRDPFMLTPDTLGVPNSAENDALFRWWRAEAARIQAFLEGPYTALPQQICHNDFTPGNVLVDTGRISAVLDFEFVAPAARALDLAMALRMAIRPWEMPVSLDAACALCRGFRRWTTISEAEIEALPWLIRLRSSAATLWWLGRQGLQDDLDRVPSRIAYMQPMAGWLDREAERLVGMVTRALG